MILSVAMMIDFLGLPEESQALEAAVAAVLKTGEPQNLTADLGGNAKTTEVTNAVIAQLLG